MAITYMPISVTLNMPKRTWKTCCQVLVTRRNGWWWGGWQSLGTLSAQPADPDAKLAPNTERKPLFVDTYKSANRGYGPRRTTRRISPRYPGRGIAVERAFMETACEKDGRRSVRSDASGSRLLAKDNEATRSMRWRILTSPGCSTVACARPAEAHHVANNAALGADEQAARDLGIPPEAVFQRLPPRRSGEVNTTPEGVAKASPIQASTEAIQIWLG